MPAVLPGRVACSDSDARRKVFARKNSFPSQASRLWTNRPLSFSPENSGLSETLSSSWLAKGNASFLLMATDLQGKQKISSQPESKVKNGRQIASGMRMGGRNETRHRLAPGQGKSEVTPLVKVPTKAVRLF